jgi:hypothetical protein
MSDSGITPKQAASSLPSGYHQAQGPPPMNGWLRASIPVIVSTKGYNTPRSHIPSAIFRQPKSTLTCRLKSAPPVSQKLNFSKQN